MNGSAACATNGSTSCESNVVHHMEESADHPLRYYREPMVAPGGNDSVDLVEPTRLLELLADGPKSRAQLLKNPTITDRKVTHARKCGLIVRIGRGRNLKYAHAMSEEARSAAPAAKPKKRPCKAVASARRSGSFALPTFYEGVRVKRAAAMKVVEACDALLVAVRDDVA